MTSAAAFLSEISDVLALFVRISVIVGGVVVRIGCWWYMIHQEEGWV